MHLLNLLLLLVSLTLTYLFIARLYHIFYSRKDLLSYPSLTTLGPFTNLAYILHIKRLHGQTRTEHLHERHKTAPIIRLGPDRLSFSSPSAIRDIYGTNTVCSKGDQYSTPGGTPNLLSVVDRVWHSIKRERISAAFATTHLLDWQEKIVDRLQALLSVMDGHCIKDQAGDGMYIDMRYWSHLFTLDSIMSIALSYDSFFLEKGADMIAAEASNGDQKVVSLRDCLFAVNRSLGSTVWSKKAFPFFKRLDGLHSESKKQQRLASQWPDIARYLARHRVERYEQGEALDDLFTCLLETKSGQQLRLDEMELVAETAHLIDAGSDTTSITLTHTLYCPAKHPEKLATLIEELGGHVDPGEDVPRYDQLRNLPYLRACLDESMRLRPALSAGMQRETPSSGATIAGRRIPGNVFVSVPAYVSHRDPAIYPEPEAFLPERWLGESCKELQRYSMVFSAGGRVCIGKNIAYIELSMALTALVMQYTFELPYEDWKMQCEEHFNMWPSELPLRLTPRARTGRSRMGPEEPPTQMW